MKKYYCVYIITNLNNTVLYTGVTGNIVARIYYHKINKLVYYEIYEDVIPAIAREKQIKAGNRQKKIDLINNFNSQWKDLYSSLV